MWHTWTCRLFEEMSKKTTRSSEMTRSWAANLHWPCIQSRRNRSTASHRKPKVSHSEDIPHDTLRLIANELWLLRDNKRANANDTVCRTKSPSGYLRMSLKNVFLLPRCPPDGHFCLVSRFTSDSPLALVADIRIFYHFRCTLNRPPSREGDPLLKCNLSLYRFSGDSYLAHSAPFTCLVRGRNG